MTIYSIIAVIAIAIFILAVILFPLLARSNFKRNRPDTRGFKRLVIAGLIILTVDLITGCGDALATTCVTAQPTLSTAPPRCATGSLIIDGSSALWPFVQLVANDYQNSCTHAIIIVQESNSANGLSAVEDGTHGITIGDSDVPASPNQSDLVDHKVAIAIFCVITSKDINVTNLTTDDLKGIYNGTLKNWSQVGGPDEPITVYSRPDGSGTRETFQNYVLGSPEGITTKNPSSTTDAIVNDVARTKGAIGYATLYEAENARGNVNFISIDGVFPSASTVENNSYHFWSFEHMYTKSGHTSLLTNDFLAYMSSMQASDIARAHSFLSTVDIRNNMFVEISHCSS